MEDRAETRWLNRAAGQGASRKPRFERLRDAEGEAVTLRTPVGRGAMGVVAHPAFEDAHVGCMGIARHPPATLPNPGQLPVALHAASRRGLLRWGAFAVTGAACETHDPVPIRQERGPLWCGAGGTLLH